MKKRGRKPALTPDEVERVRDLYQNTAMNMSQIARHFGVSQGVVIAVVDRKGAYK